MQVTEDDQLLIISVRDLDKFIKWAVDNEVNYTTMTGKSLKVKVLETIDWNSSREYDEYGNEKWYC